MKVITWNIQWGCGVDGRVDLARMVKTARAMADFDVICLQEIADNFSGLKGLGNEDQFAQLSALLPGYTRVEGFGVDVAGEGGRRRRFGNAIFSRLGVLSARRHALPWPADSAKKTMPRVAVEVTLQASMGPVRLTTTHLEYYSTVQRQAQARRLRTLHDEACQRAPAPGEFTNKESNVTFDPTPQTADAILAGDFNFPPENPAYGEIQSELSGGGPAYRDAWAVVNGRAPHPPTFCLHARTHAKEPYCCDFIFVSETLAPRVRSIEANLETQDSDHQPMLLELDDH
ncbi:MAG: endonuclease/exonuclease/phosphatase family protein [Usitatibacter sp.]